MYRQRRVVRPSAHETTRRVWEPLVVLGVGFLLVAQTLAPMAAIAATIQTDLFVYQNGDTVTVTGDGFGATETVDLFTTDPAATVVDHGAATTDSAGGFSFQFSLNAIVGGLYTVTATGETSGLSASTQFDPPSLSVNPPTSFAFPQTGVGISSAGHSFTVTNASGAQKANNVTVTSTNNVDNGRSWQQWPQPNRNCQRNNAKRTVYANDSRVLALVCADRSRQHLHRHRDGQRIGWQDHADRIRQLDRIADRSGIVQRAHLRAQW